MRFIRSLLTAISVLALTAAAATAHPMPTTSADGLATAAAASGHTVAAGHLLAPEDLNQEDEQQADENLTEDEANQDEANQDEAKQDETDADTQDASTEDSHCIAPTTDTAGTTDTTEEPNHGAVVCGAAQAQTPDGYANHSAYVSEVGQANHGHQASETAKAKHAAKSAAKPAGHGTGHNG